MEVLASSHDALLNYLISMDEGAKRISESIQDTNYEIIRYCYNLLFDENLVTQHILHWDKLIFNICWPQSVSIPEN